MLWPGGGAREAPRVNFDRFFVDFGSFLDPPGVPGRSQGDSLGPLVNKKRRSAEKAGRQQQIIEKRVANGSNSIGFSREIQDSKAKNGPPWGLHLLLFAAICCYLLLFAAICCDLPQFSAIC